MRFVAVVLWASYVLGGLNAHARDVSACPDLLARPALGSAADASVADSTGQLGLKDYANRFRNQRAGVLVTPALGRGAPEARRTRAYLQRVLDEVGGAAIAEASLHVIVNIYSGRSANAFATSLNALKIERRLLGVAEDGKPIYEIAVLQGMLPLFRTQDELAFVMGHELAHITLNHLRESKGTIEDDLGRWVSRQQHEVDADLAAIDFMRGKYDLEAAQIVLGRLLDGADKNERAYWSFMESHHHPSVRLATITARLKYLRQTDERAAPRTPRPLQLWNLSTRRTSRANPITRDARGFRDQFWQFFDQMIADRAQPVWFTSTMFTTQGWKVLADKRVMKDVTNDLFVEGLGRIEGLELPALEKVERVFELLTVFERVLYAAQNETTSHQAIGMFGAREVRALDRTLRRLSFGPGNDWEPARLIELYDRRASTQRWGGDRRRASEAITSLVSRSELNSIFPKYARVSARWHRLIYPALGVSPTQTLPELFETLSRAFDHSFDDRSRAAFVADLAAYPIDQKLETPEDLEDVQKIFTLRVELKCPDDVLRASFLGWLDAHEAKFKRALITEFDRLLTIDLEPMSLREREFVAYRLSQNFSNGRFREGLDDKDLAGRGHAAHVWLDRASRLSGGNEGFSLGTLRWDLHRIIAGDLIDSKASRTERITTFAGLLGYLRSDGAEPFLSTLTDQEYFGLLDGLDQVHLPESLILAIAEYTGLPIADVRDAGLRDDLIERFRAKNPDAEVLEKVLSERPDLKAALDIARTRNSNARFAFKTLLGAPGFGRRTIRVDADRLERWLRLGVRLLEEERTLTVLNGPHLLHEKWTNLNPEPPSSWGEHLLDVLLHFQRIRISFPRWSTLYHLYTATARTPVEALPLAVRDELSRYVVDQLARLPSPDRDVHLLSKPVLKLLPVTQAAEYLADHFERAAQGETLALQSQRYERLRETLALPVEMPDLDELLRHRLAERRGVQPGELAAFFGAKANLRVHHLVIRGVSGLVAVMQQRSIAEQLEFIEYVTGRVDLAPAWLTKVADEFRQSGSGIRLDDLVMGARSRLMRANSLERGLALLPFFCGEHSILEQPGAPDVLLDRLLVAVAPAKRALARTVARGILRAEGRAQSLAFALILGLKSDAGGELTEGEILRALFSYGYGVPGIKFAQYLAFTSEFRELLGELQDQALPISYFEAIRLLEEHFPTGLPDGLRVIGIKGSGSVNVAIEYFDPRTGANEILSVPRDGIEVATRDDFRRLQNAVNEVIADEDGRARFGFMRGLLETIRDSVELEFDRPRVHRTHRELAKILDRTVNGWRVKMVDVGDILKNRFIRMNLASGAPARVVNQQNFPLYRRAMRAASTVITDHLMRRRPSVTGAYFADSDFHDGQAFIDAAARTVWLIDPGQSIEIDADQFGAARLILRVLANLIDVPTAVRELNASTLNPRAEHPLFVAADLAPVFANPNKNDAFIRFIALTREKGGRVPLPTVQWVLGMTRQLALDARIDAKLQRKLWWWYAADITREAIARRSVDRLTELKPLLRVVWDRATASFRVGTPSIPR